MSTASPVAPDTRTSLFLIRALLRMLAAEIGTGPPVVCGAICGESWLDTGRGVSGPFLECQLVGDEEACRERGHHSGRDPGCVKTLSLL
jgi:hypothetical protein